MKITIDLENMDDVTLGLALLNSINDSNKPEPESMDDTVSSLCLTARSDSCLKFAKIKTIEELTACNNSDLLKIPNFGKKSLEEIKHQLSHRGLRLREGFLKR